MAGTSFKFPSRATPKQMVPDVIKNSLQQDSAL